MRRFLLILFGMMACGCLWGQQTPETPATFAVATIKPRLPDATPLTQIRGNRFWTDGTTFVDVFKYAFNVHPDQMVGGPAWLRTDRFSILADPESEKRPTSDEMKAMVQQLLVQRFHVVMHHEQRVMPVYALQKSNGPLKLTPSTGNERGIPVAGFQPGGVLHVGNATMANFAGFLQRYVLDRPTVDQTGMEGRYDLELHWTPDNFQSTSSAVQTTEDGSAPNLFTAIKEQLGLKLVAMKAPVDVFVLDRVETPEVN